jgi:hypothetical protein
MVFEEAKGRAKGVRALTTQAYSLTHSQARLQRLDSKEDDGTLYEKKGMKPSNKGHHLNGGTELLGLACAKKCSI